MIGNTNSAPIIEIKGGDCMSSYLTFVENSANPNVDVVSAALGKGNEDEVKGVGKALAMYAKFKGETGEFTELMKCDTMNEVSAGSVMKEMIVSDSLMSLIESNEYVFTNYYDILANISDATTPTATSKTFKETITITAEHISGETSCCIWAQAGQTHVGTSGVFVKLNSVEICTITGYDLTTRKTRKFVDLQNCGILEPGEYILEFKLQGSSVSQSGHVKFYSSKKYK